jgi:hypothetical protein
MRRNIIAAIGIVSLVVTFLVQPAGQAAAQQSIVMRAARGLLVTPLIHAGSVTRRAPMLSGALVATEQRALRMNHITSKLNPSTVSVGTPRTLGCSDRDPGGNVRVNQDCSYQWQAEEDITYNPTNPTNLIAANNDGRVGFNQCSIDWSLNDGALWGDMLPPFRAKLNDPSSQTPTGDDPNSHTILGDTGTDHTYDAASDPTVAFDSRGNAYFSCVALDINSSAQMTFVLHSPAGQKGSFYFTIAPDDRHYVVDEENNANLALDKPFMTADHYTMSPNRDNVYDTWTVFQYDNSGNYLQSSIYGSMSTDNGTTWSTPQEISGSSPTLCFLGDQFDNNPSDAHKCDFDQGSVPTVLPNGDLEVLFNNGNTPQDDPNSQQLGVHCRPTGSSPAGTADLHCAAPVKVGDDFVVGEPQCDFGRGPETCVPGPFIRTADLPSVNQNAQNNHLYVAWQDYRNGEYDIQMAQSFDGGLTWTQDGQVNPDTGLDHYMPSVETEQSFSSGPDRVGVSYYRSARVPNENSGPACPDPNGNFPCFDPSMPGVQNENSDYVLAGGTSTLTPYNFRVVSPVFPPPDGVNTGFNGDYGGLTINRGNEAHPIWSDTRNVDPFAAVDGAVHDEDIFTDLILLPSGRAIASTGRLGRT